MKKRFSSLVEISKNLLFVLIVESSVNHHHKISTSLNYMISYT
jgi:hypothetical protein